MQEKKIKLNIHNGPFKLRANLKLKEPIIQKNWDNLNLIREIEKKANKKLIFHSGPPYANGEIHIGHTLNILLKDFIFRYHSLKNEYCEFVSGWDTHGLPIALKVSQEQKITIQEIEKNPINFRNKCLKHAYKFVNKQKKDFQRLGILTDWKKNYLTLDKNYISQELKIFSEIVRKKLIFESLKPVYWSWSSQTALADWEVIYKDKKSQSIWFYCQLINEKDKLFNNAKILVWTTTPWTIPENKYLAINQKEEYIILEKKKEKIILAKNKLSFFKNYQDYKIIKNFKGIDLIGKEYRHPYLEQISKILHSDHVNLESGSGVVHIAPAFGIDDYHLIDKKKFKLVCAVDKKGFFNQSVSDKDLIGIFYEDAEKIVIEKIKKMGNLEKNEEIIHSYAHDWRTKKPLIYRATRQIYLDVEKLQPKIQKIISEINWFPEWSEKRMKNIAEARTDWCLSRQRIWGVPIPIFYNEKNEMILDSEIIDLISEKINKEGDNIWWEKTIEELLPKRLIKKWNIVKKGNDTFDVWFDSGVSGYVNYFKEKIDFIWEGNDQFRGWFNSSIIINAVFENKAKIKNILTHGFVTDEKGTKMSKSLGNVINPKDIWNKYGSDILRLWVLKSNYFSDSKIDYKIFDELSKEYVKIRNTMRFILNNLYDFQEKDYLDFTNWNEADHLINLKLNDLLIDFERHIKTYNFNYIFIKINHFIQYLSTQYFFHIKPFLYTSKNNQERKKVQSVLFFIWKKLMPLINIFFPHTAEEIYEHANFLNKENKKSTFIFQWNKPFQTEFSLNKEKSFDLLIKWLILKNYSLENLMEKKFENNKNCEWEKLNISFQTKIEEKKFLNIMKNNEFFKNILKFTENDNKDIKNIFLKISNIMNKMVEKKEYQAYEWETNFLKIKELSISQNEKLITLREQIEENIILTYCNLCRIRKKINNEYCQSCIEYIQKI